MGSTIDAPVINSNVAEKESIGTIFVKQTETINSPIDIDVDFGIQSDELSQILNQNQAQFIGLAETGNAALTQSNTILQQVTGALLGFGKSLTERVSLPDPPPSTPGFSPLTRGQSPIIIDDGKRDQPASANLTPFLLIGGVAAVGLFFFMRGR